MFGRKRNVVMVEKDVYETMTKAFRNTRVEREHNKELVAKLKTDLTLLDRELIKIGAKITEFTVSVNTLEESIHRLDDYSAKSKLSKDVGYIQYIMGGIGDKKHRLKDIINIIKRDVKPFEDAYPAGGDFEI